MVQKLFVSHHSSPVALKVTIYTDTFHMLPLLLQRTLKSISHPSCRRNVVFVPTSLHPIRTFISRPGWLENCLIRSLVFSKVYVRLLWEFHGSGTQKQRCFWPWTVERRTLYYTWWPHLMAHIPLLYRLQELLKFSSMNKRMFSIQLFLDIL